MLQVALYYGDIVQVALVAVSAVLAVVSVSAYKRRAEARYLLLMFAFVLLCVASAGTALAELVVGAGPATVQFVEEYLNPSLELLMVASFLAAVLWSKRAKKGISIALLAAFVAVGLGASAFYLAGPAGAGGTTQAALPIGCSRPAGGFLIVTTSLGYNDSIGHGAPQKNWPILNVARGDNVSITVCNEYSQAVGFQVAHYLADRLESIPPGQTLSVSFLANEPGTYDIYCSVFNPIHIYLQGGELNVS